MRLFSFAAAAFSLLVACGGAPRSPGDQSSRVVLYRNGVGYFERDLAVDDGELRVLVRNHELDDVLATLVIVDRTAGGEVVPVAALPVPDAEEDAPDDMHVLRFAVSPGPRRLRLAWATRVPVWRVSYRLVLPDEGRDAPGHLSGWAVVDNTTAEDWRSVELSLTTAEPLSFGVDLRTPSYVERPDVTGYLTPRIAAGAVFAERVTSLEPDRDSDGILDADDRCPEYPEQYNGIDDEDGCPDRGSVVITENTLTILEAIYFDEGSSALPDRAMPILDAIAATMSANPQLQTVEVEGHADTDEGGAYLLAIERAAVVRAALVARGVGEGRLTSRGYGVTRPVGGGRGADARARNRRATFQIHEPVDPGPSGRGITASEMARSTGGASVSHTGSGGTRYTIARPVDVPAGQSALVAAMSVDVAAEEVYLFRPDAAVTASQVHPYRAARLANSSEVDLVPGPIALYGRGQLLGQGLLEGLRAGEDVVIPWALDDATRVTRTEQEQSAPSGLLSVVGRRAIVRRRLSRRVTHTIEVGRHAPPRMLIRHAISAGARLVSPPPGTEHGPGTALVPVPLRTGETSVLVLAEERFIEELVDLRADLGIDLRPFIAATTMGPEERARMSEIAADRAALRQNEASGRALRRRLDEHGLRSAELRAALSSLPDGATIAAVRRRLAAQLLRAVSEGEALSAELANLRAEASEARARLDATTAALRWPRTSPLAARGGAGES